MDEVKWRRASSSEGFCDTYVWQDARTRPIPITRMRLKPRHIILSGEMTLTMCSKSQRYGAGERCDVPAGAVHSAEMGPDGCRYLIGER